MNDEINIIDVIRPLWQRRYELIFSVLFVSILTSCSLYLLSEKLNYNAEKFYHQDIKFNDQLDQKYVQLFSDPDLIRKSYLENGLDPFNGSIVFDIINHTTRYDAMKENVAEDTAELIIETFDVSINEEERSLWETYLNLDTDYYQLIFNDANLTEIESMIIISGIIDKFNSMINSNNFLDMNVLSEIAFDKNNINLLYLDNRLQRVNTVLSNYRDAFQENNFDTEEVKYKAEVLMAHIYNKDPSPLVTNLEKLNQNIGQNEALKSNLEELHSKFYSENEEANLTNTDTQLTVDSVSQLIDLGRDFSQLNNKMELIDTIYNIDLSISSLKNSIFELNAIQKLYLSNYEPLTIEQVHIETQELIQILNLNIKLFNDKKYQQAVFTVGDTYIKENKMFEINLLRLSILITLAYFMLHIVSIYLRNANTVR
jgi:hypothetical protein